MSSIPSSSPTGHGGQSALSLPRFEIYDEYISRLTFMLYILIVGIETMSNETDNGVTVKAKTTIAASIAAAAALSFMAAPANAEEEATPSVATTSSYVPDCLAEIEAHPEVGLSQKDCLVTSTLQVDDSFVATAADISASALSSEDKAEILNRRTRGAITAKHWSQFTTGAAYTRTHNGTFYYDGSRVWVTTTTSGYTGSHQCFTNYSVGFNLSGTACNESGSASARNLYSAWDVNPNGTPIVYNVSMTATVKANGTISGYGATVG